MKFLFDLLPVVLFFVAFKLADIYVATAVAIGTTVLQVAWLKLRRQRIPGMLWASLAIIVVFGGATLALQDETFIKWKPTVLYWLFAAALAGAELLLRRNLIRAMLGEQVQLPDALWARLNWSWTAFFVLMGFANLYVAFVFAADFCANVADLAAKNLCENNAWVNFKLFGATGLMLLFVIAQALVLARYVEDKPAHEEER